MCLLCILIPVVVGLLCAILGFLLGRLSKTETDEIKGLQKDLESCRKEREKQLSLHASLKSDTDGWKKKFDSLQAEYDSLKLQDLTSGPDLISFNPELAAKVFGKRIKADDLKIVEGIGPKIEKLFHNAGIKTWKALAETPVERCQKILDEAGPSYRIHEPDSWPKQSEMAHLGKWAELKEWQDMHTAGRVK